MSVEPVELMSELWTQWQGHVVADVFRLGRYLGCSDHSGVFLTNSAALGPADLAIKLIPIDRVPADSQQPPWTNPGAIVHPHLLGLLRSGECRLDGYPYRYVVMEYADQTLAQVLQRRALTDDEAREMLRPVLEALAFLHSHNWVQGHLTPANILVVGDQLKLASDTVRLVGEDTMIGQAPTAYASPEARHGINSTAADIWALGVCLFEALTRRAPSSWVERSEAVALPTDFSPAFREVVARCLNLSPQMRPSVTELIAWDRGQAPSSGSDATIQSEAIIPLQAIGALEATTPGPMPPITSAPAAPEAAQMAQAANPRALLTAGLAAVAILALGWTGVRLVRSHGNAAQPAALEGSFAQGTGAGAPMAADVPMPGAGALPATSPLALHEEIPEVSQSTRRTIRGHIQVSVRIIVDPDGSVITATADRIGSSRHLQRLATEAARKWTFPAVDTRSRRVIQISFDFSRDGTTASAVTLG